MRADQRKFHYIYKITRDDGSGKYYIGMHSTDNLEDGYFGSGQLLWKSIAKHGKEKHTKEILEFLSSRDELKRRERQLVNEEILDDPFCMNLKLGGEGGGGFKDDHHQRKAGLAANKSAIRKLKQAEKNKLRCLGKPRTWESSGFSGKCHSQETRKRLQKPKNIGIANSQYGTCWVMKDDKNYKIKKELRDEYVMNGYSPGRKMIPRMSRVM